MPEIRPSVPASVAFAAYLAAVIFGASVLGAVIFPFLDVVYDKVFSRALILMAVVLLWPLASALRLSRDELGIASFRPPWLVWGWVGGVLLILPPAAVMFAVGFRVLDDRVDAYTLEFGGLVVLAALSGLIVGVVEELLFRGLIHGLLRRWLGFFAAATVGSALYAVMHFLKLPEDTPVIATPGVTAGVNVLLAGLQPLASPLQYWDSFISLWLLGMVLCWVRNNSGQIWICVGLHAAFVLVIRVIKDLTVRDVVNQWAWIVGEYDHFVGHLISVWIIAIMLTMLVWRIVLERSDHGSGVIED